jgi:hypothetical protein
MEFWQRNVGDDFLRHQLDCARCRQCEPDKPATLVNLCYEGSLVLKNKIAKESPKKRATPLRDEFFASKQIVREAMKYK